MNGLHTRNVLIRYASRRRLTTAGKFWTIYVVGLLVCVYAVVDLVERVMR